jgi:hypothetical protein
MQHNPIEIWNDIYQYEESIASETETLDVLKENLNNTPVINAHIKNIKKSLANSEDNLLRLYKAWSTEPDSYRYGSEAYYQSRILAMLRHLQKTPYSKKSQSKILCARMILKPSAFNGSPRIKRVGSFAFVVFPAPTVYWMYEIMGMISALYGCGQFLEKKIHEYLIYLIAARSFEHKATHETSYSIDFLIDVIAHSVLEKPNKDQTIDMHGPTPLSQQLVYSIEEFIISHELSHDILDHDGDGSPEIEAAADRNALEMMQAIPAGAYDWVEGNLIDVELTPWLGYLALRLWTNIRLAAEIKVVPWIFDAPSKIEQERSKIFTIWEQRVRQIDLVGNVCKVTVPSSFEKITKAADELVNIINNYEIDSEEVGVILRYSNALASGQYVSCSDRIFSDYRRK